MKVHDKVVNINSVSAISAKAKRKEIKEGTTGVVKKITPAKDTHLPVYHVKFPGHDDLFSFYRFEIVKLRA